jgi:ribonuclease D
MTPANLPDPIFIARPAALQRLANSLIEEPIVAVDTESNSLYAYQEQVCLIQFSTPKQDFLVDPLSLKDLSPLAELFRSPKVEKVFHAAEYDLICLKRDFGFEFANLFDTMIAARILGREGIGLGSLLEDEFGVHLDKRYQRANWGRRPIPGHLLAYAQLDTHYLISLRHRLRAELKEYALWRLANEDFTRVISVDGRSIGNNKQSCWRINGIRELDAQKAAVLKELCQYRDQVARKINRPLFKVMGDRTLLAIAVDCPKSLEELREIPGMSRRQIERHGKELLSAVERGLQAKPIYPPRSPRPNEDFLTRLDALRSWRKRTALEMGVKSDIVLPRDLLYKIAERDPQQDDELTALMRDNPWRLEQFGDQILYVLAKS